MCYSSNKVSLCHWPALIYLFILISISGLSYKNKNIMKLSGVSQLRKSNLLRFSMFVNFWGAYYTFTDRTVRDRDSETCNKGLPWEPNQGCSMRTVASLHMVRLFNPVSYTPPLHVCVFYLLNLRALGISSCPIPELVTLEPSPQWSNWENTSPNIQIMITGASNLNGNHEFTLLPGWKKIRIKHYFL